jgi:hypothetical protein
MSATRQLSLPPVGARLPTVRPTRLELVAAAAISVVLGAIAARSLPSSPEVTALLLLAAALPFAAAAMGGLKRLLLAIAVLNIAFNWDVNFAYDETAADRGALGGLSFSLTTIALLGLFALWLAEVLAKRRPETGARLPRGWALPGALYVVLTAVSLLAAHDRQLSVFELAVLLQGFLLFVYVVTFIRTERDLRFVVGLLVVALVTQGALIVAARYLGLDLERSGRPTPPAASSRRCSCWRSACSSRPCARRGTVSPCSPSRWARSRSS